MFKINVYGAMQLMIEHEKEVEARGPDDQDVIDRFRWNPVMKCFEQRMRSGWATIPVHVLLPLTFRVVEPKPTVWTGKSLVLQCSQGTLLKNVELPGGIYVEYSIKRISK